MVPPHLGELEGNANACGGDVEGRNDVSGRVLAQFSLNASVFIRVDGDGLVAYFLLAEVNLQIVQLIFTLQDPLYAIEVRPELISDAVERSSLEVYLRLAEALQAAISLEQVWLEFPSEIDHVRT